MREKRQSDVVVHRLDLEQHMNDALKIAQEKDDTIVGIDVPYSVAWAENGDGISVLNSDGVGSDYTGDEKIIQWRHKLPPRLLF